MPKMEKKIINFNLGVLGHVDSGKTSLAKVLSTVASTACFDKNPQSKERGITLDLGFSSFIIDAPYDPKSLYDKIQVTLVDCPGHASLIRTVIGGAQIIDSMLLVIDITKGLQTQTAECIVIGEILCNEMLIILNKIDMIEIGKRKSVIEKMEKKIKHALKETIFANAQMIPISAAPNEQTGENAAPIGIDNLMDAIRQLIYIPKRDSSGNFIFSVDHCFSIRGQGTVITGTVLQGAIAVNSLMEVPMLSTVKKVKSIQMFHKPVEKIYQGERAGICVTQFDSKLLERGIVGAPGVIKVTYGIIASVEKISYFKMSISSRAKFHVTIGHETVLAKVIFFKSKSVNENGFEENKEYIYEEELSDDKNTFFAVLEFERPIYVIPEAILIGSKLDIDVHSSMCRLVFKGRTICLFTDKNYKSNFLATLKVFKNKCKEGIVDRLHNDQELIVKSLFKRDTNLQPFLGLKVTLSSGEQGTIDSTFGQSGKIKIRLRSDLLEDTKNSLKTAGGKKNKAAENINKDCIKVYLNFKKYIFSMDKKVYQS